MKTGMENIGLLSSEALQWLRSSIVSYGDRNHEERMALIKVAKMLYPDPFLETVQMDIRRETGV